MEQPGPGSSIIALAGRRVDAEPTDPPGFASAKVPLVRRRLGQMLVREKACTLVCSAACGADLIALKEAERLGIRRRIVLPFEPDRFRESSVTDRPGNWGPLFDRLISAAATAGDLMLLGADTGDDNAAYAATNEAIVSSAQRLAETEGICRLIAVVVWEGAARAGMDATEGFRQLAQAAGFKQLSVLTV